MKIRSGFVSNSSSSSFVLLGYVLDKNKYKTQEIIDILYTPEQLNKFSQKEFNKDYDQCDEDEKSDLKYDIMSNGNIRIMDHIENGAPDRESIVFGKMLGCFDSEGIRDDYGVTPFSKHLNELSDLGKKFDNTELQVVVGIMCS